MFIHEVKQGECLSTIASSYGFVDLEYVWSKNSKLARKRPDWNVLFPGDEIIIPPKREKKVSAATEQRHTYKLQPLRKRLHLIIQDENWSVIPNAKFSLRVMGKEIKGTTKPDGSLDEKIPFTASEAELAVWDGEDLLEWRLLIGHLNPVVDTPDEGVSGMQQRLQNLGLFDGPITGMFCAATAHSLAQFQRFLGLRETGEPDWDTVDALRRSRHAPLTKR